MVNKEEAIRRLVKAYPNYLAELERTMGSYLDPEGNILWFSLISRPLSKVVMTNFSNGDYECSDELFKEIEVLIANGTQEVREIICTGFLESMQNQTELEGKLWAPLLGPNATVFCEGMDKFYGVKTEGLNCYNE